jgi:hypothetical protein
MYTAAELTVFFDKELEFFTVINIYYNIKTKGIPVKIYLCNDHQTTKYHTVFSAYHVSGT